MNNLKPFTICFRIVCVYDCPCYAYLYVYSSIILTTVVMNDLYKQPWMNIFILMMRFYPNGLSRPSPNRHSYTSQPGVRGVCAERLQ